MDHKMNDTSDLSDLEEKLAAFTDQIRAGADPVTSADLADLEPVVRRLDRLMPRHPVDDVARARITLRVMGEWDARHSAPRRRWQSMRRSKLLVAGVGWALLVSLLLAANAAGAVGVLDGTALGGHLGAAALVVALPAVLAWIVWWLRHTRP